MLFSPLALRGVKLRNRVGLAPMSQYCAEDNAPTTWHLVHYATRAQMTGLTMVEATAISHDGLCTPQDLGIWHDSSVEPFRELSAAIAAAGSVPALQLSHAGRKACRTPPFDGDIQIPPEKGGWLIVGPSPVPFAEGYATPVELSRSDIARIVADYRAAALRAHRAGFQALELHGGHGRLMHSFYSPIANRRTDDYGGSWENRVRLLLEVVVAVRTVWPVDLPLIVRLSCVDWISGGWDLDDSVRLAAELRVAGVDMIDCTSGGVRRPITVPVAPGYQVAFAREIRRRAGIATAAVGMINSVAAAASVIESDSADLVLVGRRMLLDPYLPFTGDHSSTQLVPMQYERGIRSLAAAGAEHIPEL